MALDIPKLRGSFEALAPKGDQLMVRFYELLFAKFPQVKPLFSNASMPEQRAKLLRALALVVKNLEQPGVLVPYLEGLGRMHVAYGAVPGHYDAVGGCLLEALADTAGPIWNDGLKQAWTEAYQAVASIMLKGAGEKAPA